MVKFTSTLSTQWLSKSSREIDVAVAEIATDIHRRATMLAPVDTRALVSSGVIERNGTANYTIRFGSARVPYARIRHFENKRNPQTLGYLEKAGDSVARGNVNKYLRGTR